VPAHRSCRLIGLRRSGKTAAAARAPNLLIGARHFTIAKNRGMREMARSRPVRRSTGTILDTTPGDQVDGTPQAPAEPVRAQAALRSRKGCTRSEKWTVPVKSATPAANHS
jgi:hypothetical protein